MIDNCDSFTYHLYQFTGEVNGEPPMVVHNDVSFAPTIPSAVTDG